jgi:uncharacterized repeat protein (TIGR03803 family)
MKILRIGCVLAGFLSLAFSMPAQTFTQLLVFDQTDGSNPQASLIQATNGNFYGTTSYDGNSGYSPCGTVFEMTKAGKLTMVYSFPSSYESAPDGCGSVATLVQKANGNLYGTTAGGGRDNQAYVPAGTIFEITPGGKLTTLYKFCAQQDQNGYCTDGAAPMAALLLGADGNFYGTTSTGAIRDFPVGGGTVFKITQSGVLTTLHTFCPDNICTAGEGFLPEAPLIQGTDGNFYGTTLAGGTGVNGGTVFKITPGGELTTLYSFCQQYHDYNCNDGNDPEGALVQGTDGNFYGTTGGGGPGSQYGYGQGTVFKITPNGAMTQLHGFEGPDGGNPHGLIPATDGNFYGTTSEEGANGGPGGAGYGTVFQITPSGTLTTLYSFCPQVYEGICPDGNNSVAALVQANNGTFYGTTNLGGNLVINGSQVDPGTIFSLSVGLGPFVTIQPAFGKVGATVKIWGTNLTGASSVTFNGTAAVFKVVKSSEITATVPTGAGTGSVTVTTPSGPLASSQPFRVTPKITSFTPPSGPVGTQVTITGVSLAQTTIVTFGGVQATTVNVNSDAQVTAAVPTGALTGKIAITAPGGTATSAKSFKVTP